MGAFFSGTDDANENMTQFYAVWGRVMDKEPAFTMRYVVGNTRVLVPMSAAFDIPQMEVSSQLIHTYQMRGDLDLMENAIASGHREEEPDTQYADFKGPWAKLDYPADWMTQHTKKTYAASGSGWSTNAGKRYDPVTRTYVDRVPAAEAHTSWRPVQRGGETLAEYNVRLDAWEAEEERLGKLGLNLVGKDGSVVNDFGYGDDETRFDNEHGFYGDYNDPDLHSQQLRAADFDKSVVELRFREDKEETDDVVESLEQVFQALTDSLYHWDLSRYVKDPKNLM